MNQTHGPSAPRFSLSTMKWRPCESARPLASRHHGPTSLLQAWTLVSALSVPLLEASSPVLEGRCPAHFRYLLVPEHELPPERSCGWMSELLILEVKLLRMSLWDEAPGSHPGHCRDNTPWRAFPFPSCCPTVDSSRILASGSVSGGLKPRQWSSLTSCLTPWWLTVAPHPQSKPPWKSVSVPLSGCQFPYALREEEDVDRTRAKRLESRSVLWEPVKKKRSPTLFGCFNFGWGLHQEVRDEWTLESHPLIF